MGIELGCQFLLLSLARKQLLTYLKIVFSIYDIPELVNYLY
ncbi:hypothetical protein phiOC_p283 [Ochrobactrum phage vB_OspM_OC]|nr:hypothetical protein phiOC_p283 [Ochrobactrum phage vB_OspM_OC]